jgi:hypothetical protein
MERFIVRAGYSPIVAIVTKETCTAPMFPLAVTMRLNVKTQCSVSIGPYRVDKEAGACSAIQGSAGYQRGYVDTGEELQFRGPLVRRTGFQPPSIQGPKCKSAYSPISYRGDFNSTESQGRIAAWIQEPK